MNWNVINKVSPALIFVCLMSLLTGCGGDSSTSNSRAAVEQKSDTELLFSFLPNNDYFALGFVNIDSLMESQWSQQLIEFIPDVRVWDEKLGVNINQFHHLAIAIHPPDISTQGREDFNGLIIMSSDLSTRDIMRLLGEKSHYFKKTRVGELMQYTAGSDFSFGFVDDGIVAIGTPRLVEQSLKLVQGKGEKLTQDRSFRRFERYLATDENIWFGIGGINEVFRDVAENVSMMRNFSTVQFAYYGMKAGENIETRMVLECKDEEDAGKIARGLSGILGIVGTLVNYEDIENGATAANIQIDDLKQMLEDFFKSINIISEQKDVVIRFEIPASMIEFAIEQAHGALQETYRSPPLPDDLDNTEVIIEDMIDTDDPER